MEIVVEVGVGEMGEAMELGKWEKIHVFLKLLTS